MAAINNFEDLDIWKDARDICQCMYKITDYEHFSKDYRFCSQVRAAAGSIMDNIAEGFEREGNKEFIQFLYIAKGSCGELRSQIIRAYDCHYISEKEFNELKMKIISLSSSIFNFIQYLRKCKVQGNKYNHSNN